ncbi:MAG: YihY/virulence factor BrkB family protein [Eubacterium sp.]|jgi:membrane protein|nr:YihY/virulence factor BrkB family protein [Eubacterium sp.]
MTRKRFRAMVLLGVRQLWDPYYQGFAAQIAFFLILSIVPTVTIVTQILGLFHISATFMNQWIHSYVMPSMVAKLRGMFVNTYSTGNNIFLVVTALWAASRAQFSLMRIANYTYSGGRTTGNYWKERVRSLRVMLVFILTIVFVIAILVYGKLLLLLIFGRVVEHSILTSLWSWLRWPLALVLYFLVVLYDYYVLPIARLEIRDILPGSVFASLGMLIMTLFYSIYVNLIANYDIIYGSLSAIVALLFWFWLLSWVMVLGILFNKVWSDTLDLAPHKPKRRGGISRKEKDFVGKGQFHARRRKRK